MENKSASLLRGHFNSRAVILMVLITLFSCARDEVSLTGDIAGIVKDRKTSETLQGCAVTLSPLGRTTTTGTDGRYEFKDLQPETYSLEFSKDGYEPDRKNVVVMAGQSATVDVMMNQLGQKLILSAETLDFGDLASSKDLIVSLSGSNTVAVGAKASVDWLTVTPQSGTASKSGLKLTAIVSREGLAVGEYAGSITLTSALGTTDVPVTMKVSAASAPEVVNAGDFYEMTETSFKLDALIKTTGGAVITRHGHCWSESGVPMVDNQNTNFGTTTEVGQFTSNITGLTAGKTYQVRAYAENKNGISYSPVLTITMKKQSPVEDGRLSVSTGSATDQTTTSAVVWGSVVGKDISNLKEYGFYFGTNSNPTAKRKAESYNNTTFKLECTSLSPNTTYCYKAYAVGDDGEICGELKSFTTSFDQPNVETLEPTNIGYDKATLVGHINQRNATIKEYGFYYGKNQYQTRKVVIGTSNMSGSFTSDVTNLEENTKYVYAAYAVLTDKTVIQADFKSFTTGSKPKIARVKYNCVGTGEQLTADLYMEVEANGYKIKDAGFLIGDSYYSQNMTLHYTYDHMDIIQGKIDGNKVSSTMSIGKGATGGKYVVPYAVMEDGLEVYAKWEYLYDGFSCDKFY